MNFRIILFIFLGFIFFQSLTYSSPRRVSADWDDYEIGDSTRKPNTDSIKQARERINDSTKEARTHLADSIKSARTHSLDSAKASRQRKTDSTAMARKYKDSKRYKDSVAKARNKITTSVRKSRQSKMDSVKDARKAITDSIAEVRKTRTETIKSAQKSRTDSLARIKKYRTSKRYADSVAIARRTRTDSVKSIQKSFRDSIAGTRKHTMDSTKVVRKHAMDSMKTARTKILDSIKVVRKNKTDSLAKAKKQKEALAKAKEKKKSDDKSLKLEIKMKQKHEAWTNKSMLKKRWSPIRRLTQNSFTHYNYYYNANKKMEEAKLNMERGRKENYDSLIGLYVFDPNKDSSMMTSDMDTIVRKISVAIQIHDPRVKWSNDLYLLLGQAFYYRGKYENASIAFRYIISQDEAARKKKAGNSRSKEAPSIVEEEKKSRLDFLKHKSVHNDAIMWLARTYTEAGQAENAESILSLLEADHKLSDDLKGKVAVEKAFAYMAAGNYSAASTQLSIAANDDHVPEALRMRCAFLNGQLLQNNGNYKESAASFEKVVSMYPKLEMDFYARKHIATNKLLSGEDVEEAMQPLKKVLNDGKYVSYYDQVYFVMGQLAVKAHKNDKAITYLTKSAKVPKATRKQKALTYAALGDVYYANANYTAAKQSYDSAAKYANSGAKDNTVTAAIQRSKGLEDISGPSKVIHDQDSLLELSELSKKEQLAAVRRHIRDLEKQEADSIIAAETSGVTSLTPVEPEDGKSAGGTWYFGNPSIMQQGKAEFERKWGTRPLKDNWRRGGSSGPGSSSSTADDDLALAGTTTKESGIPTEESLLAKIPNNQNQKDLALKLEHRAYILLAKAYIKQLDDYKMALKTLDTLDVRFPKHNQKEEELYLRYQIALKQNQLDKARAYAEQLLELYPKSQYASIVKPRNSESKPDAMIGSKTVAQYYAETYDLVMAHQYTEALMHVTESRKQFENSPFKKRFEVVEAMAYAGSGKFDLADTAITKFITSNPTDSLSPWANQVKLYIKEVRNGGKPSWYKEGPLKTIDTAALAKNNIPAPPKPEPAKPTPPPTPPDVPATYSYNAQSEHYCIIVLPGIDSRTAPLKQTVRDLNASKYAASNLDVLLDLYSIDQGVMVIRKFTNATESKSYMDELMASTSFKGFAPGDLKVYIISASNYKKMLADKNATSYSAFYSGSYK